jgi:hypothetical protein
MKKLALILPFASYLTLAPIALATAPVPLNACDTKGQFANLCKLTSGNFGNIIGSAIQLVFVIAVVAALFYLVYGGFRWLISTGDKAKVTEAREHIIAAIIGLVVIFLAYFIINIILGFFIGNNLSNLTIPSLSL